PVGRDLLRRHPRLHQGEELTHLHRPTLEATEHLEELAGGLGLALREHLLRGLAGQPTAHAADGASGSAQRQGRQPGGTRQTGLGWLAHGPSSHSQCCPPLAPSRQPAGRLAGSLDKATPGSHALFRSRTHSESESWLLSRPSMMRPTMSFIVTSPTSSFLSVTARRLMT